MEGDENRKKNRKKSKNRKKNRKIEEKIEKSGKKNRKIGKYRKIKKIGKKSKNRKKKSKNRKKVEKSKKNQNLVHFFSSDLPLVLYKGPSLTPELFNMLLKFRIYPIAITADIEKAFLQIQVDTDHRDFLRFLYYRNIDDPNSEIVRYRFTRVIFGATCSQFLLNGTLQKHASKYEKSDPEFYRKVREHFYVDDLNTGVKTIKEGIELYDKIKTRFGECKFNVIKWRTNNNKL